VALIAAAILVLTLVGTRAFARHRGWEGKALLGAMLTASTALGVTFTSVHVILDHLEAKAFRQGSYSETISSMQPLRSFAVWGVREATFAATALAVLGALQGAKWGIPALVVLLLLWGIVILVLAVGVPRIV